MAKIYEGMVHIHLNVFSGNRILKFLCALDCHTNHFTVIDVKKCQHDEVLYGTHNN